MYIARKTSIDRELQVLPEHEEIEHASNNVLYNVYTLAKINYMMQFKNRFKPVSEQSHEQ